MNARKNNDRYLAIHPTTYGLGFAVVEEPLLLIDWGTYRASGDKNGECLRYLDRLINRYGPRVVLIEDRDPRERQRSERIRRLVRSAMIEIRRRGIALQRVPRKRVRTLFEGSGAKTKQGIAICIAKLFPELTHDVPPVRKAWMPEHPRMGMFEALALALAYLESVEISS